MVWSRRPVSGWYHSFGFSSAGGVRCRYREGRGLLRQVPFANGRGEVRSGKSPIGEVLW